MLKKLTPVILAFLFLTNILAWITVYDLDKPQLLEVSFFDIGQGDSIFIETPQGHQILIDGGPSSKILEKLGEEISFSDRTIDLIILTHPEHDHIGGLIDVLERYKVENIMWTGIIRETKEYGAWIEAIEEEEANMIIAKAGQKIEAGEVLIYILYPFESLKGEVVKEVNNSSVVARLVFDQNSFLFTGDIFKSVEEELIEREELKSDILKVGHHGSKTSSSKEFIESVLPELAVIQSGRDNHYGHPHPETLEVLGNYDIKVLRTDKEGDIKILSNGVNYIIN